MSGSISPAMLIAAGGFLQGQGLGVSSELTSKISTFSNSVLTQSLANVTAALGGTGPAMPSWLTGLDESGNSITNQISTTAAQIAPDTKKFISNFSSASAFGSASFAWSAAIVEASSKGFGDFGGGMSKFSDMASGGLSQILSPGGIKLPSLDGLGLKLPNLPSMPGLSAAALTAKPDFAALGTAFSSFGKAFDTTNLQKMFDPTGFVANLQKQGLGSVGGLSDKLLSLGVDPTDIASADPDLVKQALSSISGSDLQKIIAQTGMQLPATASVANAADLLDAKKILPGDILSKIPGGNFAGLGNALTNMGGSFKSPADLSKMLGGIQVPDLKHMDALDSPLPDDIKAAFAPMLGAGSGPFGNPTVNDIIGTAAGHGHTEALASLAEAQTKIMASPVGQAFKSAADALASDPSNPTKLAAFVSAQTAITSSGNADLAKIVSDSTAAIAATATQLATEVSNLSVAGITPTAAVTPPPTALLGVASKLHDMGVDKQQLGFNTMLTSMAGDSVYGDAIKATLMEGKNIAASAAAGIANTTKIDPMAVLKKVQST